MTSDERERTINFIIQQQAKFEADMQLSKERFEAQVQRDNEQRARDLARDDEQRIKDQFRISQVEACMVMVAELTALQSRRLDEHAEWMRRRDEK